MKWKENNKNELPKVPKFPDFIWFAANVVATTIFIITTSARGNKKLTTKLKGNAQIVTIIIGFTQTLQNYN